MPTPQNSARGGIRNPDDDYIKANGGFDNVMSILF